LREALVAAHRTIALSSLDWSAARDTAVIYGLFVGWDDDEAPNGVERLGAKFGWQPEAVDRLRRLRAAVAAAERGEPDPALVGLRDELREHGEPLKRPIYDRDLKWLDGRIPDELKEGC
jgi:hypothetical protein